ncbi:MAG: substrate-binding domain-containing protein [Treponema sp.]|jgi:signal transduction histidine kinase/DNA-binding LacI/PurR family transcriptional regulator|nr:substrate-binding domain-containing protein [Treponema sp.]
MRIALFLNNLDGEYQLSVYRGVREEARKLGIGLLSVQGEALNGKSASGAGTIPTWKLIATDGILLLSSVFTDESEIAIPSELKAMASQVPFVSIGMRLFDYHSIIVKNRESMELLMEHLIMTHGYRDFIYVGGPAKHQDNVVREDVFRKAIKDGERAFPGLRGRVYSGIFNELSGMEIMRNHIALHPERPDCIVAGSDNIAIGIQELLQSLSDPRWRNCPVTGFDDISQARLVNPPLTTVRQPLSEQGRMAVRAIRDLIRGIAVPGIIYVESTLILRSSCGCPERPEDASGGTERILPDMSMSAAPYDIIKSEIYSLNVNSLGHNLALIDSLPVMIPYLQSFLTNLHVRSFYFILYGDALENTGETGYLVFERSGGRDLSFAENPPAMDTGFFFRKLKAKEEFQDLCLFHLRSGNEYLGFVLYEAPDQVYPQMSGGAVFIANTVKRLRLLDDEKERSRRLEQEVAYRTKDLLEVNRKLKEEGERRIAVEAEVLRISDLERRRFSADLHDDICQRLAGISMFCKSLAAQDAPGVFLPELSELIDETLIRTRRYAHDSFPMDLDAFGLREAVAGLCDSISREGALRCSLSWDAPDPLPLNRNQEINIYRIIQEALQNVLKHSGAELVRVKLSAEDSFLLLQVRDNGKGMGKGHRRGREGLGLRSMEYRAHQLGAEYRLRSRKGSTAVEITMPLALMFAGPKN